MGRYVGKAELGSEAVGEEGWEVGTWREVAGGCGSTTRDSRETGTGLI